MNDSQHNLLFQDAQQPTSSKIGVGEFKVIKGRKCKVAASEFVVKISNRFDVLKEDGEDTQHASKVINSYFEQNSSSRDLIKPIKSVEEGFDKSITKRKIKASELTKKYSIQHSSKSFGWIQASKSEDCVEVNRSKVKFSDQQLTSADQGYIVNVRKRNKKKFPQHTFKYKKVEMMTTLNSLRHQIYSNCLIL